MENTLGQDEASPRLFFKKVVTTRLNGVERSLDMSITDASSEPENTYTKTNAIDGSPFTKYTADTRQLTGVYLATARIGIDNPGTYVFRFAFTDTDTGEPVNIPMAPLTFYDIDGAGEVVATCDATSLIGIDTALTEETSNGCYVHSAKGREVNLPRNFESLSGPQKAQSITYVYTDKQYWDVQFHLAADSPARYFIFKSSTVLACDEGGHGLEKPNMPDDGSGDSPKPKKEKKADA
jgi:hypothetical protein